MRNRDRSEERSRSADRYRAEAKDESRESGELIGHGERFASGILSRGKIIPRKWMGEPRADTYASGMVRHYSEPFNYRMDADTSTSLERYAPFAWQTSLHSRRIIRNSPQRRSNVRTGRRENTCRPRASSSKTNRGSGASPEMDLQDNHRRDCPALRKLNALHSFLVSSNSFRFPRSEAGDSTVSIVRSIPFTKYSILPAFGDCTTTTSKDATDR